MSDTHYQDLTTIELMEILRLAADPVARNVLDEVGRRLAASAPTQTIADDIEHVRATLQAQIDVLVDDRFARYRDADFRTRMRQARGER